VSSCFNWDQVIAIMAEACSPTERRVLLVLSDRAYHVREVLAAPTPEDGDLFGFVVYTDDPAISATSDEANLLFVRPEQIVRVQVSGGEIGAQALGF
jgi:hypothetical protein